MLIAFIGGGNMATALISGLTTSRSGLTIRVSDPNEDARNRLRSAYGIDVSADTARAVKGADVIVLAIKPQVMPLVLGELADQLEPQQLVLSIAAGVTIDRIAAELVPGQVIIRSMPNTPALVGEGVTGLCAGPNCKEHHRQQAERVLRAAGEIVWIPEESMMDAVTAVSGSGPAYFFALTEALADAGVRLGLPAEVAQKLAASTCSGAGAMLRSGDADATELRRRVTSPGGTTQAALEALTSARFSEIIFQAAEAACKRGAALSGEPGG